MVIFQVNCFLKCVCIIFVLEGNSNALLDLTGLDTSPLAQSFAEFPSQTLHSQEMGASLLDDELMSLGESLN